MPKARKSFYVPIDQAAACSVAFILLLLYLSMARSKNDEPIEINMPATTGYICRLYDDALILVGQGKVFLYIPDTLRKQTLLHLADEKNIPFSPADVERFKKISFIGMPVSAYKHEINAHNQPGLSLNKDNNELATWIDAANIIQRSINKRRMRISIKADKDVSYTLIKSIISTLQDQNINKFSFITATKIRKDE
jgi:hypothetical protein